MRFFFAVVLFALVFLQAGHVNALENTDTPHFLLNLDK